MSSLLLITRHAVPNYGSFLQTLATVKYFSSKGHKIEVLDYIPEMELPKNLYKPMLHGSSFANSKLKRIPYTLLRKPDFRKMGNKFREFQKNDLPLTKEYNTLNENISELDNYDLYITGSDQVWGPIALSEYDRNYFWDFLSSDHKIMSFSASFGNTHFSDDVIREYKRMLSKFDAMTVRESSAVKLIADMGLKEAKTILDPTMMIDKQFWYSYAENKRTISGKYVLVYQVHNNPQMEEYAKKVSRELGLPLVRVSNSMAHVFRGGKFIYLPTPQVFLELIKNSEYVVTNSFHATVFSLIFDRRFSIVDSGKTNTRIRSLLDSVELTDRQIADFEDFSQLKRTIDYNRVNDILDNYRETSDRDVNEILSELIK